MLRQGDSLDQLKAVCEATGADRVVWQTRVTPHLRARDADVRAGLEDEAKRRLEEKTMDLLLERAEVELPPLLVEHEVEHLLEGDESFMIKECGF